MAVAFGAAGTNGTGTTSVAPGYPTVSAGDLIILCVLTKSGTIVDPSGWTVKVPATTGGSMTIAVYTKVATGSESGSQTVNITSGTASQGKMISYTAAAGHTAVVGEVGTGEDNVSDVSGVWTTQPAILQGGLGDLLLAFTAVTDDQAFSSRAMGWTGSLTNTNRFGFNHTASGGSRMEGNEGSGITVGSTYVTFSATIAAAVTGITAFLVLHETAHTPYRRRTSLGLTFR